jgi:hypothetical protein
MNKFTEPDADERQPLGPSITPTHAPSEGQTGDDAEFAEEVFPVEFDGPGGAGKVTEYRVDADYARKLLVQRDSARKERDAAYDRGRSHELIEGNWLEVERDRDALRASHAELEAQVAGKDEALRTMLASAFPNEHQHPKMYAAWGIGEAALLPTSGQALLDRLKKAESIFDLWHPGPAKGGENMWEHGDTLLIAVETSKGWDFAIVGINADEDHASMEDEYGESYTAWEFEDIAYWIHKRDIPKLLPSAMRKGRP